MTIQSAFPVPGAHRSLPPKPSKLRAEIAALEKDPELAAYRKLAGRVRSAYRFEKIGLKATGVSLALLAAGVAAVPFLGARALLCLAPGAALMAGGLWVLSSAQDRGREARGLADDIYSRRHEDLGRLHSLRQGEAR